MATKCKVDNSLLKDIIDSMPDVFFVLDSNEKIIFWNKSLNRLTGYTNKKISNIKADDLFSKENSVIFKKAIENTIKNGSDQTRIDFLHKPKKIIPFEFHCSLIKNNKKEIRNIRIVGHNVSEKIEWYNAAQEKTNKFVNDIMNNISDPLLILDANLKVISINSSFYKTYNATPETTLGYFVYNIGDKQWNIPKLRQSLEEVLPQKKVIKDLIIEHNFPDTGKRIMKINARQISSLQIILFTVSDVTLDNEVNSVKNSLTLTQNIVNTLSSPYIVVDSELKVVSANNSFFDTFGVNQSEIERHYIYELGPKKWEMPELKQLIEFVGSKKQDTIKFKIQYDFPNVGKRSMSLSAKRLNLNTDKIKYILIVIEDTTEQKKLEEEKNSYLSIAAHDLRTPMTVIKGYSNMLLEGDFGKLEKETIEPLTEIFHASSRMIRMINDFLTISRIEQGRLNIENKRFDLIPLLKEISAQMELIAKEKKIELTIKKIPNSLYVWADPDKILEVLFNIFDNAVKFTEKGAITVNVTKENNNAIVSITDTGPGISKEHQKDLFSKFFQIHSGQSISQGKESGLGLGLYISRLIVETCGGRIWVESELGIGSTFSFSLPCPKSRA